MYESKEIGSTILNYNNYNNYCCHYFYTAK